MLNSISQRGQLLATGVATAALCAAGLSMTAQAHAAARPPAPAVASITQNPPPILAAVLKPSTTHHQTTKVYVVKPGDSLSAIAARVFHKSSMWPRFYATNHKVIGPYPDIIFPGQRLSERLARHGMTGRVVPIPVQAPSAVLPIAAQAGDNRLQPRNRLPPSHNRLQPSAPLAAAPSAPVSTAPGGSFGACVRSRESGGNYQVMNSSGHYGAYQFSASTWAAYGGSPGSFGNASPAEQDQVFANAVAQGGQSNWAPYDGCG